MTDPFSDTDDFKDMRARQRQRLARLPLDILRGAAFGTPEKVHLPNVETLLKKWPASTVEQAVRTWADAEAQSAHDTFESAERYGGGDIRRYLVAALQYGCEPYRHVFGDSDWSPDLLEGEEPDLRSEAGKAFQRAVTLMVLADTVADDGYVDPRLSGDQFMSAKA